MHDDLREMLDQARRKIPELRKMQAPVNGTNPQLLADQLEKWAKEAERLLKLERELAA